MWFWWNGGVWLDDVCLNNLLGCPYLLDNTLNRVLVSLCRWTNRISSQLIWIWVVVCCCSWICLLLPCMQWLVLEVVGGPFLLGKFSRFAPSWQLKNNAPSYISIALARILFIIVHSTCMGPFIGGVLCGWSIWVFWRCAQIVIPPCSALGSRRK